MAMGDFAVSVLCDNGAGPGVLYHLATGSSRKNLVERRTGKERRQDDAGTGFCNCLLSVWNYGNPWSYSRDRSKQATSG
jgi:hypothetical protein